MKRFMLRVCNSYSSNFSKSSNTTRRNTSSTSSTTKLSEPSTDEKAAEISQEAWPTLKKYLPVIIPVLFTTMYSVLIINNEKVKEWTEEYVPSYVNFLRTYHGFELENIDEINRIKATIANQMKQVSVVVRFHDGSEEYVAVNGNESYEKLQDDLMRKYSNDNSQTISNIYFKDDDSDSDNDGSTVFSEANHILLNDIIMKRSLWDCHMETLDTVKKQQASKSNKNPYTINNMYGNTLLTIFKGFNNYLALTKTKKLTINTDTVMINYKSLKRNSNTIQKAENNTNIDILLDQLKHLEWELKNGMKRSIEDVQEDIRKTNTEISNLRRKSLWFYWF